MDACLLGMCAILHQVFQVPKDKAKSLNLETENELSKALKKSISTDEPFGRILSRLKNGERVPPYEMVNDCLVISLEGESRWCLPKELIPEVMNDYHDRMGHPGIARTLSGIQSSFYRPGLRKTVQDYVASCSKCQRSKPSRQLGWGEKLENKDIPSVAFHTLSLDLVTGLPPSNRHKFDAMVVIQCLFTKMVVIVPCREKLSAEDMGEIWLDHIVCRGFSPARIISDMGPQFISGSWKRLQEKLGTILAFSAPYHQQANPVERSIQTLEIMIRAWCNDHPQHWHRHLKLVELAFNASVSSATGFCPFDLLYTSYRSVWPRLQEPPESTDDLFDRSKAKIIEAQETLKMSQERHRAIYNKKHRSPPDYKEGDLVLVRLTDRPLRTADRNLHKLRQIKRGPYRISEVLSRVAVKLDLSSVPDLPSDVHPVFTVDQVEPFVSRSGTVDVPTFSSEKTTPSSKVPQEEEPNEPRHTRAGQRPRQRFDPQTHEPIATSEHSVGSSNWLDDLFGKPEAGHVLVEKPILYHSRQLRPAEMNY